MNQVMSYINLFLKSEITCIPRLLTKYIGHYYNNALFNGATWLFLLWCILHLIFDRLLNSFLQKIRYKEYVRNRLISSLWYLEFFGTAFVYCGATLRQNEIELFNFKKMHVPSDTNLYSQVLGYTLISTFYFHSSIWEGIKGGSVSSMITYLLLALFLVISYILRIVEISFTLTALISISKITLELTRCAVILSNRETFPIKIAISAMYVVTFAAFLAVYMFVIPLTFVVPMGLKMLSDYPNTLFLVLFCLLVSWLTAEIYNSFLFKAAHHWLYHTDEAEVTYSCNIIDCSLFVPRDDVTFNLHILRHEIKAREARMMSMRKPKNRNMLIQTLKCMVAIKRKLSEKRFSDSSDSDDSEKSEDSELRSDKEKGSDLKEFESDDGSDADLEESDVSNSEGIEMKTVEEVENNLHESESHLKIPVVTKDVIDEDGKCD